MPCYDAPPSKEEQARYHERTALRILREAWPNDIPKIIDGPTAVSALCFWCQRHSPAEIKKVGATYWYADHKKYDLRQSGLAKLSKAEREALGL